MQSTRRGGPNQSNDSTLLPTCDNEKKNYIPALLKETENLTLVIKTVLLSAQMLEIWAMQQLFMLLACPLNLLLV